MIQIKCLLNQKNFFKVTSKNADFWAQEILKKIKDDINN